MRLFIGAAVLGLCFAGAFVASHHLQPETQIKRAVAERLIDPSSAMFRNIRPGRLIGWCGEVNAKNRMGAYAGFELFYANISSETDGWDVIISGTDRGEVGRIMREVVADTCRDSE